MNRRDGRIRQLAKIKAARYQRRLGEVNAQKPFNRRAIDHRRQIKKKIASKELVKVGVSFLPDKNESLLSVKVNEKKKRRERERERESNRNEGKSEPVIRKGNVLFKNIDKYPLTLSEGWKLSYKWRRSIWHALLLSVEFIDFRISADYTRVRGGLTVCRIFALFCRCLLEECRRAEPDHKAGLTWQFSYPCLLYDNSAIFAQTRRTSSKEQTNY